MSDTASDASGAAQGGIDPARFQMFLDEIRAEQNLPLALLTGSIAAAIGAGLWTAITVATNYQIGFMAVGVGLLVGVAVRKFGKGIDKPFGIAGAGLSLLGCAVGNLLTACQIFANHEEVPLMKVVSSLTPNVAKEIMVATFSPMDLLFYGIAVYEGYRLSFGRLTRDDLDAALSQQSGT